MVNYQAGTPDCGNYHNHCPRHHRRPVLRPSPILGASTPASLPFKAVALKNHRVVPRYQNIKFFGGLCGKFFKPPNIGGGLVGVDVSFRSFLCARENGHHLIKNFNFTSVPLKRNDLNISYLNSMI